MNITRILLLAWAALLVQSLVPGAAHAAPGKKAPSVHVETDPEDTEEERRAARLKPVEHVDLDLPENATRHQTILALAKLAYESLEDREIGTEEIGGNHAVLALWNPEYPAYGLDIVNVLDGRSRTEGVDIEVIKRNGVGSTYAVTTDTLEVLALRTNVTDETWKTTVKKKVREPVYTKVGKGKHAKKKRTGWRTVTKKVMVTHFTTQSVSYIPFSVLLDSFEMRAEGLQYLDAVDQVARFLLWHHDVKSKVDPSKNVIEIVPPLHAQATLINEHTDHTEFDERGGEWTTHKVLVHTATNREVTYDYSGSWAFAYGYAQFIQSSYLATVKGYPKAKLIKDFRKGMRDHVNAVMAQYCYMDGTLLTLTPQQRTHLLKPANRDTLVLWLAAAYNGAPARAAKAYTKYPTKWVTQPCTDFPAKVRRQKIPPCLAGETRFYLRKAAFIHKYLRQMHGLHGLKE